MDEWQYQTPNVEGLAVEFGAQMRAIRLVKEELDRYEAAVGRAIEAAREELVERQKYLDDQGRLSQVQAVSPTHNAAVRRASMDLTRALSNLRAVPSSAPYFIGTKIK